LPVVTGLRSSGREPQLDVFAEGDDLRRMRAAARGLADDGCPAQRLQVVGQLLAPREHASRRGAPWTYDIASAATPDVASMFPAAAPGAAALEQHDPPRSSAPQGDQRSLSVPARRWASMPVPSKSGRLRVASTAPRDRQMAAMSASNPETGLPDLSRALAMMA
jgi:hypothetical protein